MKKVVMVGVITMFHAMCADHHMTYESGVLQPTLEITKSKQCKPCDSTYRRMPVHHNKRVTQKYSHHKHEQRISLEILRRLQANVAVLLFQTLHYHWNLRGEQFNDYHKLFNGQYVQLFADLDLVAERVRAVDGDALGSMQQMLRYATIKEDSNNKIPHPRQMVTNLHDQYKHVVEELRHDISVLDHKTHDHGSKKMLEDLIEKFEKINWMLRSLLGK